MTGTAMRAVEPIKARDYTAQQIALVKRTVASDTNDMEFNLFFEVAKRTGLDPFRRQIYAIVYNKDNPEKRKMSIVTGIDGFRAVADRSQKYRPDDEEPTFTYSAELKNPECNPLGIEKCVVRCFKLGPNNIWHPVIGVAYWDEFAPMTDEVEWKETGEVYQDSGKPKKKAVPTGRRTLKGGADSKWRTMPRVMLAKCAEAQAIRKGWPEDLSGIYAPEEIARAERSDLSAADQIAEFDKEERMKAVGAREAIAINWKSGDPLEMVPIGKLVDRAAAFFQECKSRDEIEAWARINQVGLREFWARSKTDALGLKAQMEKRIGDLAALPPQAEAAPKPAQGGKRKPPVEAAVEEAVAAGAQHDPAGPTFDPAMEPPIPGPDAKPRQEAPQADPLALPADIAAQIAQGKWVGWLAWFLDTLPLAPDQAAAQRLTSKYSDQIVQVRAYGGRHMTNLNRMMTKYGVMA